MTLPCSVPQLVGRALIERFPTLKTQATFDVLLSTGNKQIETGDWIVAADSGLQAIYLHFRSRDLIEVACRYRDCVEEFEFFTDEAPEGEIASTLIRFLELLLSLPQAALSGKRSIRDVLDYRECMGIY